MFKRICMVVCTATIGMGLFLFPSYVGFAQEKATISFWCRMVSPVAMRDLIEKQTKMFEQENPGVSVKVDFLAFQASYDRTLASLSAGNPPEVAQQGPDLTATFAAGGHLRSVENLIDEMGREDFFSTGVEGWTYKKVGYLYAIPWFFEPYTPFYRKDLFQEAGVSVPKTWSDLAIAAQALTKDTNGDGRIDQYGLTFQVAGAAGGQFWVPLGISNGGLVVDWVDKPGGDAKIVINSSKMREALKFVGDLVTKYKTAPPGILTAGQGFLLKMMGLGGSAMNYGNGWHYKDLIGSYPELKDDVGAFLQPVNKIGDVPRGFLGGHELFLFKDAAHPELGEKYVKFLFRADNYKTFIMSAEGGILPVRKSIAADPWFTDDPVRRIFAEAVKSAVRYCDPVVGQLPATGEAEARLLFSEPLLAVIAGDKDPAQALADTEKTLKELYER